MRPIFCGNLEYDARQSELERLFRRYGKVDRVDMKSGRIVLFDLQWHNRSTYSSVTFSFQFPCLLLAFNLRHLLRCTHCQPPSRGSRIDGEGTHFPLTHHETYSWILVLDTNLSITQGFAFIYMEDERDAEAAIRALDRVEFGRKARRLRVEWTKHERGIRRPTGSRRSSANGGPSKTLFVINFDTYHTRTRDLERHFEPYGKIVSVRIRKNFAFVQYESEDDASKALEATNMSKLLDRVISVEFSVKDDDDRRGGYSLERSRDRQGDRSYDVRRSPSPYSRERGSPYYGHGASPYKRERGSPDYGRGRNRSRSPPRREQISPAYGRRSPSPYGRERDGSDPVHGSSCSPIHKKRVETEHGISPSSHSADERDRRSPQNGDDSSRSPYDAKKASPENGHGSSSPYAKGKPSPYNGYGGSPDTMPEPKDSPTSGGPESPMLERSRSQSAPAEE